MYYTGNVSNNYVLFSGMLFRIVKVNDDGTVLIVSNDNINNLRYTEEEYENSNIDKYLNDVYLKAIHDDSYIVSKDYCVGNLTDRNNPDEVCNKKINRKVSLLTYNDYVKSNSYLFDVYNYVLANKIGNDLLAVGSDYNDDKTIKFVQIKNPSWKIGSSKRKSLSQTDRSVPGVKIVGASPTMTQGSY